MNTKLVFVYNADSGLFNTVTDIAHKILSPKTYSCQLCALTHSYFTVRDEWVNFLQELDAECDFLHRDELEKKYGDMAADLPAIFKMQQSEPSIFMDKLSIEACKSINDLKQQIQNKLRALDLAPDAT